MKKKIAFAMIMGVATTGIISFLLISVNLGYSDKFLKIWFKSWLLSYTIVIPCILVIGPVVERFVNKLFPEGVRETE
ncbi:DUF2798 domain-containing protein [Emticicia sp. CRIBPO]|uniref:DUF2798 domain-containing protein n=1 Tax=Emticicia sp. CRIBPO TaxID=2683258 RepID=UPI001412042D|nr:DUF2798 domain-containing protein [Emticicia sp. CRIBPO]NBA85462.1 DUF2798 domain-containing protein [Emticicia sp. CRIBPO]